MSICNGEGTAARRDGPILGTRSILELDRSNLRASKRASVESIAGLLGSELYTQLSKHISFQRCLWWIEHYSSLWFQFRVRPKDEAVFIWDDWNLCSMRTGDRGSLPWNPSLASQVLRTQMCVTRSNVWRAYAQVIVGACRGWRCSILWSWRWLGACPLWVLIIKLGSSGEAVQALNHCALLQNVHFKYIHVYKSIYFKDLFHF